MEPNSKAYDIQSFGGERWACVFATDILEAIKKFVDALSNVNKKNYKAHYQFFGEDHALLRIMDMSDYQDEGYLIIPFTVFESNKVEYRSWRPDYRD